MITVNDHIEVNGVEWLTIALRGMRDYEEEFEEAIPASAPGRPLTRLD